MKSKRMCVCTDKERYSTHRQKTPARNGTRIIQDRRTGDERSPELVLHLEFTEKPLFKYKIQISLFHLIFLCRLFFCRLFFAFPFCCSSISICLGLFGACTNNHSARFCWRRIQAAAVCALSCEHMEFVWCVLARAPKSKRMQ